MIIWDRLLKFFQKIFFPAQPNNQGAERCTTASPPAKKSYRVQPLSRAGRTRLRKNLEHTTAVLPQELVLTGDECYEVTVYGQSKTVERHTDDDALSLLRDPKNPYDLNTIQLFSTGAGVLGYIPQELAEQLVPLLDQGIAMKVTLLQKLWNDDSSRYGVRVSISMSYRRGKVL